MIHLTINFHDSKNQSTYASRSAEDNWIKVIQEYVAITGKTVLDLGCGGGIYTKVFSRAGAAQVIALDFSDEMLKGAQENCNGIDNISFIKGNALETNLLEDHIDVMLERALIHHISDLEACFSEAHRILIPKGKFIIQDRTPDDCILPGSQTHIRGYFFEKFPKLIEKEVSRRYSSEDVISTLQKCGFNLITEFKYWETRRIYYDIEQFTSDLRNRTGRSILYELQDNEINELVAFIQQKIGNQQPIKEEDRWTIWIAEKQ